MQNTFVFYGGNPVLTGQPNTFTAPQTFTGTIQQTGNRLGLLGGTGITRIPFSVNPVVNGPQAVADSPGGTNVAGLSLAPNFNGSFTGITGSDPGFVWGLEVFSTIGDGTALGQSAGITTASGGEIEMDVLDPSGTIPVARGLAAGAFLYGPNAGATITQAEGIRALAPGRQAGAVGGTIGSAVSLFAEAPTIGGTNFSVFAASGAPARFNDRLDVDSAIWASNINGLSLHGGFTNAATIFLGEGSAGSGEFSIQLGKAFDSTKFYFKNNSGAVVAQIDRTGSIRTLANAAPADADIVAGEAAMWYDKTNAASKVMFKAKQADGTVKTGSIPLA